MAIYPLLQNSAFDPDDVKRMTTAYEKALVQLGLTNRTDPMAETVALRIIEIARTGEKDPDLICALALKRMGIPV